MLHMSFESEDEYDVSTTNPGLNQNNNSQTFTQIIVNKDNIQHASGTQWFNRLFTLALLN